MWHDLKSMEPDDDGRYTLPCCGARVYYAENGITCRCREWTEDQQSRGLGDTIAKVTHRVGIKRCEGCRKRQKKLNDLVPYGKKGKKE